MSNISAETVKTGRSADQWMSTIVVSGVEYPAVPLCRPESAEAVGFAVPVDPGPNPPSGEIDLGTERARGLVWIIGRRSPYPPVVLHDPPRVAVRWLVVRPHEGFLCGSGIRRCPEHSHAKEWRVNRRTLRVRTVPRGERGFRPAAFGGPDEANRIAAADINRGSIADANVTGPATVGVPIFTVATVLRNCEAVGVDCRTALVGYF